MKRRLLSNIMFVLVFFIALGVTLYPLISNHVNEKYKSEIHTAYVEIIEEADDSDLIASWEKAVEYNNAITPGTMDSNAYSQEALIAASEDYDSQLNIGGDGIMGYVEVPIVGINLPIYHGTAADSLERGVGHLLGSSLPVGGTSTHAILTGHSGMATDKMFTDITQLKMGDVFYLHILGEVLAYQVCELNTVLPYDTSFLGVVSGRDLCTLVTCTPIGVNSHRLLVRGERIPYEEAEEIVEEIQEEEVPESSWEQEYRRGILLGISAVVILAVLVLIIAAIRRVCHG